MMTLVLLAGAGSGGCERPQSDEQTPGQAPASALEALALTDQAGNPRKFSEFRGKTVVFSLFFTSCPTVCPRETRALSQVQRQLTPDLSDRVQFVSLSVDPENDSSEAMRRFALETGAQLNNWSFVRANDAATRALSRELSLFEGPDKAEAAPSSHTTAVYLFDSAGRLRQRYAGNPLDVPRLALEIQRLDAWMNEISRSTRKETAVERITALK